MNSTARPSGIMFAAVICMLTFGMNAMAGTVTVTAPNGGEVWSVGETRTITWTSSGVTGNVNILLYNNWAKVRILTTVNVTPGAYDWSIPADEPANNTYRIRVQSTSDSAATDYGDGTFTINAPKTLVVTSPNGGERWHSGSQAMEIKWTTTGLWGNADVYLYNNWAKLRKLGTVPIQSGVLLWAIPANELANNTYRIRVQSCLDTSRSDYSDAPFTISCDESLDVLAPNGGEIWPRAASHTISWSSTGLWGNVNILLYVNWTKVGVIGTAPIHDGSWTWTIPVTQTIRKTYRIRVQSQINGALSDYSDGLFGISGQVDTVMLPGGVQLKMVYIPGGTYQMGRNTGEQDSNSCEDPKHQVTLPGFWIGKYPVTQEQWVAITRSNPAHFTGTGSETRPVETVSWNTVQTFITSLNTYTGFTFYLPSEAQWEYACRAGTTTRFYWGDDPSYTQIDAYAWYSGNSNSTTHPVGQKLPNAWGLYDMGGNVWEWCQDAFHSTYAGAPTDGSPWVVPPASDRVVRGGCWGYMNHGCRSACRGAAFQGEDYPTMPCPYDGFRLAK